MQAPKAIFLSHGAGPMPLLGDEGHLEMISCLERIASRFAAPEAFVVVSAHWEESVPTVTATDSPSLIYDYHGFPSASYEIEYPCPGAPALASRVRQSLENADIRSRLDAGRGLDHGVFVPLKIMYPAATIPCVQLSLVDTLDPSVHLEIGRALRWLSSQNVTVIGSGFSFHNMKAFFTAESAESRRLNRAFEKWLVTTCCDAGIPEQERAHMLARWFEAEGARYCHPREEHLLPLLVCYGIAESHCREHFELTIMGKESSMYLW
ncbi:MAG: dioxygenase [Proteobacteria bacterium]|nr:MAG: dioxygenase [Pseudomonadota bacterium]